MKFQESALRTQIEVKDREIVKLRTLLRKVVEEWDHDGHSPTNETFAQAAEEVGFKR